MAKTLTACLLSLLWLTPLGAQMQRDPTQPPAAFSAGAKMAAPEAGAPEADAAPRVLQSIIRREGASPVAIISGRRLRLGETIDDFVLVRLTDTQATLKGPTGTEILGMSPSVDKTPVRPDRPVRK